MGMASPPLVTFTATWPHKEARVLIPGCGNAHEARVLLQQEFQHITLLDIAPDLTQQLQQQLTGTPIQVLNADFFEHSETYDLILEQTFFCALDPLLRPAYVQQMHKLLVPGGLLVGVLFNRSFEGGPPFGGSQSEYEGLFGNYFRIKKMELCTNSIPPRMGSELFFIVERV